MASSRGRRYRAAIIGHTGRGDYGHGLDTCFNGLESVEVVALADPDPTGRAAASARLGPVRTYATYTEMLERERPDLVSIAPRWLGQRRAMIDAAVAVGAHLYVDKPLAASVREADAIIDRCKQGGVRLAVAHQLCLYPATTYLHRLVAAGRIGKLRLIRGYGKMDQRGGVQDLMVLGTHILDLMRLFAGDAHWCSADLVTGSRLADSTDLMAGDEELGPILGDGLRAHYGFANDVIGSFESWRGLGGGETVFGLDLVGDQGQLAYRGGFSRRLYFSPYPYPEPGLPDAGWQLIPCEDAGPGESFHDAPSDTAGLWELIRRANQRVIADLLEAIEHDREPVCSGERARAALEMVQAVLAAHAAGGRVALPLAERDRPYHPGMAQQETVGV